MSSWGTRAGTTIAAACLIVMLFGCAESAQQKAPAQAQAPSPEVTATMPPTLAPSTTPDPTTCENAFADDLITKIRADGLTFREDDSASDAATMVGADGLRCRWTKPQTDITVAYASWPRDAAAWETLKTELLADGYDETGPFAVTRPVSEFDSAYRYRDGVIYYVSPSRFLESVAALQ